MGWGAYYGRSACSERVYEEANHRPQKTERSRSYPRVPSLERGVGGENACRAECFFRPGFFEGGGGTRAAHRLAVCVPHDRCPHALLHAYDRTGDTATNHASPL